MVTLELPAPTRLIRPPARRVWAAHRWRAPTPIPATSPRAFSERRPAYLPMTPIRPDSHCGRASDSTCTSGHRPVAATNGQRHAERDGSFTVTPDVPPTGAATAEVSFSYYAVNRRTSPALLQRLATGHLPRRQRHCLQCRRRQEPRTSRSPTTAGSSRKTARSTSIPTTETKSSTTPPVNLAVNFHTSGLPVVAQGCTVRCRAKAARRFSAPAWCVTSVMAAAVPGAHKDIVTPGPGDP